MKDIIETYLQELLAEYGIDVLEESIITFIVLLAALTIFFQAALLILRTVAKIGVEKTETKLDDKILNVLSKYFPPIAFLTALFISIQLVYPNITIGNYTDFDIYLMLLLATLAFLVSGVLDVILVWYGLKMQPPARKKISTKKIFPFVRNVIGISVFILFAVFILQIAGFDTTALITGLGIAGLAVALALQGTLSNFFGGLHILLDKPFREGDYIITGDGKEGVVDRIDWRTTKLITLGMDEVVIPNAKLAESVIVNESSPKDETGVLYTIGISYDSDIDKVVETIKKAVKTVEKKNEYLVPDTAWARLDSYGDYSLKFKFGYLVYGYQNQFSVLADVNREIFKEFKNNKIEISYPVMVVKKSKQKK